MNVMYAISGISRQGYHQAVARADQEAAFYQRLKETVLEVRKDYHHASARKIHRKLRLEGIIGINCFEEFMSDHGLIVKKQRSLIKTTHSGKYIHPNLANGLKLNGINQLWVSDITHFITPEAVFYIVLMMDVYSRRILGHSASDNMMAVNNLKVLEMAFKVRKKHYYENLIHHSDKGSQYGCKDYESALKGANIRISMAGTCLENPYAERINGIIKNDYLIGYDIKTLLQLKKALARSVHLYNNCPHGELGMDSPMEFEDLLSQIPQDEHPVMQLYDFTKTKAENIQMGFKRHKTMKIAVKEKTVTLKNKATVNHFPGSAYSLEGCSPAEPSSAVTDSTKLNQVNSNNKLTYQQLK
ncbi:MAG: IS3 family transposase [Desulfuromonadales bacterium]|nr:IS3 family transposase [Desulfuromonadales bacterium]